MRAGLTRNFPAGLLADRLECECECECECEGGSAPKAAGAMPNLGPKADYFNIELMASSALNSLKLANLRNQWLRNAFAA
ncbi:MAG: hypothetical protein DMF17_11595 [Verrucomicrobia bacterium]|nr:MAG: hypothetical protein DMF17_11595 [Verrucomicrobiota bacterium]